MQIVLLITLCIAFLSSNVIYAENIDESVTFNNTTGETTNMSSNISANSSTQNLTGSDDQQTGIGNSTELKEEAGMDTSEQNATEESSYQDPSNNSLENESNEQKEVQAAGDTKNPITCDLNSIKNAAYRVKAFIEKNKRLPTYVTISGQKVYMNEFMYLLAKGIYYANKGSNVKITVTSVTDPKSTNGNFNAGSLSKAEFITIAGNVARFIEKNGRAPSYIVSRLGKIQYQNTIYTMSKILGFYYQKKRLPNTVSVPKTTIKVTSTGTTDTTSKINNAYNGETLSSYLKSTANCQVTDANIKALAASLTKGLTSTSSKATTIFNWVRDNLNYSFYYNTKYGAAKTLQVKTGNCVDHTHLLVALARAAGIPSRYVHGTCKFNSGNTYGHVWGQLYVNGVWYAADATSYSNTLGTINNWNVSSATIKAKYAELPF